MKLVWRLISLYLRPFKKQLLIMFLIAAVVSSTPYIFSFLGKWLVDEVIQVTGPAAVRAEPADTEDPSFPDGPAPAPDGEGPAWQGELPATRTPDAEDGWTVEWRVKTTEDKLRLLLVFLSLTMGLHVLVTALSAVSELINSRMVHALVHKMRKQLYRKVISMDMAVFSREQAGQLMTRVLDDSGAVPGNLTNFVINSVTQTVMLILGIVLLLRLNPVMTLVALGALPVYGLICITFLPRIADNTMAMRDRMAFLNGFVMERLSQITTVKNYVREDSESGRFNRELEENLGLSLRQHRLNMAFNTLTTLVTGLSTLGVLGVGFLHMRAGRMQLGEVLAFHQITAQLFVPASALAGLSNVSQTLKVFAVRIFSILDTQAGISSPPDAVHPESIKGALEFENVSLRYSEEAPFSVSDINLSIPAGASVCLVGPTGSGKSTLLVLLSRLYDPGSGRIKLDGVDLRKYPIDTLRAAIGHVLHEAPVFSGTLADNIAYGLSDTPMERVKEAARAVGLADFIESREDGYGTRVGRGGIELSDEQAARLALARAMIMEPAVLTIDDTYAAIEDDLEKELRESVRRWHNDRTIIIATSRLAVCEDADMVVVMSEGRIVQCGRHDDLARKPGMYRRMFMRQMGFDPLFPGKNAG